jgi:SnoaL-like domain
MPCQTSGHAGHRHRAGPASDRECLCLTAMAHPNEDLLRRGYAAYNSGDMDTVQALFDDDIVWHAGGSNQTTGEYRGFQEIMDFSAK